MTNANGAPEMMIGGRVIGGDAHCFVIAEIGINHNGSRDQACALIDAAIAAGADAVKFQKRDLHEAYRAAILEEPRLAEQGLQYLVPVLRATELSDDDFRAVRRHAALRGIPFICTPWDIASVEFLAELDLAAWKVGSPDLTNIPLIERIVAMGRPMILSTGMSSEDEIRRTLALLEASGADYAVLHCVSTYPAAPDEINLRFLETLREWCGRPVGYSGHETGITISLAAVARGACILERHLTLDRSQKGPDHKASLEPAEFGALVRGVREVELALGSRRRWMTRGELLNRRLLAKSLVAARPLAAGTRLSRADIVSKGPGLGLSPQDLDRLVGRTLLRPVSADAPFEASDVQDITDVASAGEVDVGAPWGIVGRFTDAAPLVARFAPLGMRFVEFHLSDRDLAAGPPAGDERAPYGLVIHAPEYRGDALIDLCTADADARASSIAAIQRVIDLARLLAPKFTLDPALFPRGPKVVVHAGGMAMAGAAYDAADATVRLVEAVRALDASGVELLLENLPPQPWYFGGRWVGHVMCDVDSVGRACRDAGVGLCFDTSHAALACAQTGEELGAFANALRPFIRHLHVADAAGLSGEGLQIGDGEVNFVDLLPRLVDPGVTLVPEIWMGHHGIGEGFRVALQRLSHLHWARDVMARKTDPAARGDLASLTLRDTATVFGALRVIDANRMGIAFVVDAAHSVVGVVTDGDLRHAFVRGLGFHSPVADIMTRDFVFGTPKMTREEIRARLPGRTRVMPILDSERRLVDVANLWTVGDATP